MSRRILIIDEAHHMGAQTLNTIKHLINNTPSCVIIGCIDTLWRKLSATAWQEVRQLVVNRLFARVRIDELTIDDAKIYYGHRFGAKLEEITTVYWQQLVKDARKLGGMAWLRNVADRVDELGVDSVDHGTLIEAARHMRTQLEGR